MMNKPNLRSAFRKSISSLAALCLMSLIASAGFNPSGDDPGEIVYVTRKPPADNKPSPKRNYAGSKKNPLPKPQSEIANKGASAIGVTVWRLCPSTTSDAVEIKDLTHPGGDLPAQEVTPERVAIDTALTEGQMVRLTIESLRTGYLYVINRPRYADGKYGDPYLIFPTQRMGISNQVTAGQTIQIPGPNARPDYLILERSKSREGELQVSEELIVIVKPEPFESFKTPPANAQKLTQASVEALIEKYKADVEETDLGGDASKYITNIEKRARQDVSVRLSRDDPYPQTLYRLAVKPTDPMLVRFELKVRGK
jgi:hypothetical protein